MNDSDNHINNLQSEISELKSKLEEANGIIDAIREGAVDALVLTKDGKPHVYSLESADYTYRILIEKFGEGALSISDAGLILYCNEYFSKLVGLPSNKITGTNFKQYLNQPSVFEKLMNDLKTGPAKAEMVLNSNDRTIHAYISLTDLQPNVSAIGIVVTDLTEKRKHEEALVQYQQRLEMKINELNLTNTNLEQFIHVISHDLKEPIRKILMYTSHLSETKAAIFSDSDIGNLNVINSSALRLNSLVDDLVKYAFSATKDEVSQIDLNVVLSEIMEDLELIIKESNASVISENLRVISGSKVQMRQLMSNLLSNAIKYSKKDRSPVIQISSEIVERDANTAKRFYKVSLRDNGIGMESAHLTKIFTIFQRLHMRNEYSGNGIGLAICKKIMENHHGKIDVESVPGSGSIFNLYFPITD